MPSLDASWFPADRASPWAIVILSVLLGMRHATDLDHLAAVTTLVAGRGRQSARPAALLGLTWGLGHGLTLVVLGVPVILAQSRIPEPAQRATEVLVGVLIVVFAVRLLRRWRREAIHTHVHDHPEGVGHAHLHTHGCRPSAEHPHAHIERTPLTAFGIGLVHGVGGSAGPAVLLLASIESKTLGVTALLLLALGTAVSMTALSTGFGLAVVRLPRGLTLHRVTPVLGVAGASFGAWYGLTALGVDALPLQ